MNCGESEELKRLKEQYKGLLEEQIGHAISAMNHLSEATEKSLKSAELICSSRGGIVFSEDLKNQREELIAAVRNYYHNVVEYLNQRKNTIRQK